MSKSLTIWEEYLGSNAKGTQISYRKAMDDFLEYEGMNYEELFSFYQESLASTDIRDRSRLSRKIRSYQKYRIDVLGHSTSYADQIRKAISSFFRGNGYEDFRVGGKKPYRIVTNGQNIADVSIVQEMLKRSPKLRTIAVILSAKDSGLRPSDLRKLDWGDFRRAIVNGETFVLVDLNQRKTGASAKPIFGPESVQAIKEHMTERAEHGETLTDSTPIFVTIEQGAGRRMNSHAISGIIKIVTSKLRQKKLSYYSLRKFNTTFLQAGRMPELWIARLQGREITDSRRAYTMPTDQQLLTAYEKAYGSLRVLGGDKASAQKIDAQGKRIEELESQLDAEQRRKVEDAGKFSDLRMKVETMMPAFAIVQRIFDDPDRTEKLKQIFE